jgi:hypothetical protein
MLIFQKFTLIGDTIATYQDKLKWPFMNRYESL